VIGPEEIRLAARRGYAKYLSSLIEGTNVFPLDVRFPHVKSGEAAERYAGLREELAALRAGSDEGGRPSYHVEWMRRTDRAVGSQMFPARIFFPDADSLLGFLGKRAEAERFAADYTSLLDVFPVLSQWAARHPDRVVSTGGDWDRIVAVLRWFIAHPRPGIFLREIPAVENTKFIENNKRILRELLDIVLPPGAVEGEASDFEERYGLRRIEQTIRLRILDRGIADRRLSGVTDLAVPVSDMGKLGFEELGTLIIVENKASFSSLELLLTLPELAGAAGVFGSGFAAHSLGACGWMGDRRILYWGDVDTHGLRILAGLRGVFPRLRSVLMDEDTFSRFPEARTDAPMDLAGVPNGLTEDESVLFRRLASLSARNRLEQERIPAWWAAHKLPQALSF
jgi:hypothetical protein